MISEFWNLINRLQYDPSIINKLLSIKILSMASSEIQLEEELRMDHIINIISVEYIENILLLCQSSKDLFILSRLIYGPQRNKILESPIRSEIFKHIDSIINSEPFGEELINELVKKNINYFSLEGNYTRFQDQINIKFKSKLKYTIIKKLKVMNTKTFFFVIETAKFGTEMIKLIYEKL